MYVSLYWWDFLIQEARDCILRVFQAIKFMILRCFPSCQIWRLYVNRQSFVNSSIIKRAISQCYSHPLQFHFYGPKTKIFEPICTIRCHSGVKANFLRRQNFPKASGKTKQGLCSGSVTWVTHHRLKRDKSPATFLLLSRTGENRATSADNPPSRPLFADKKPRNDLQAALGARDQNFDAYTNIPPKRFLYGTEGISKCTLRANPNTTSRWIIHVARIDSRNKARATPCSTTYCRSSGRYRRCYRRSLSMP